MPTAFHLTQTPITEDDLTMALSNGNRQGCATIGVLTDKPTPLYYSHDYNQDRVYDGEGICEALTTARPNFLVEQIVRRLTPLECERLQGFPDGWTEGFSDACRYKMLGNAVAVPVVQWIGDRIMEAS